MKDILRDKIVALLSLSGASPARALNRGLVFPAINTDQLLGTLLLLLDLLVEESVDTFVIPTSLLSVPTE